MSVLISNRETKRGSGASAAIILLSLTSVLAIYAGYWLWEVIKALWPIVE